MSNPSLVAAVDRFKKIVKEAGEGEVVMPGSDAALICELICKVEDARCILEYAGEQCICGMLDVKCDYRI